MAADLQIHIWDKEKLGEEVLKVFFHNSIGHKLGMSLMDVARGKGWNVGESNAQDFLIKKKYGKDPYTLIAETPHYYVGENSTLKRALTGDDGYLYGTDRYWEWLEKWNLEEITEEAINTAAEIDVKLAEFLKGYMGKNIMSVNW